MIQFQLPMTTRNDSRVSVAETAAGVQLEMSPQSFAVLSAPGAVLIRCLSGWVWITQEANRNDTVLDASQECQVAGSQRVFLNAWGGARLAISLRALPARDAVSFRSRSMSLRLKIARGAYMLSGVGV